MPTLFDFQTRSNPTDVVVILYAGSIRTFSINFQSVLLNVMAASPFRVVVSFHFNSLLYRDRVPPGWTLEQVMEFGRTVRPNVSLTHPLLLAEEEMRSFFATIQSIESYTNLYGERIALTDSIIGLQINFTNLEPDQAGPDGTDPDIYRYVLAHNFAASPWNVIWAVKSEFFAGHMAHEWALRTGSHFVWGFRQRWDVMYPTNVWETIFEIRPFRSFQERPFQLSGTPISLTVELPPDTYWLVGDHLYRVRRKADKIYTLNAFEWGGINDQALMGYGEYMVRYSMRWNTTRIREWMHQSPWIQGSEYFLYNNSAPITTSQIRTTWRYHPETFSQQFLMSTDPPIPFVRVPFCYYIMRGPPYAERKSRTCEPNNAETCEGCTGLHPNNIRYLAQNEHLTAYLNISHTSYTLAHTQESQLQRGYSHLWTQFKNSDPRVHQEAWTTWTTLHASVQDTQHDLLNMYLATLGFPPRAVNSSNYYYFYRYRMPPIVDTQCVANRAEEWSSPYEGFHSHYWPFIHLSSHLESLVQFVDHIACKGFKR
jgi:hypothetical protein